MTGHEGMVVVYDYDGEYVGCMGVETWRWMAAHPEMDARRLRELEGVKNLTAANEEVQQEIRDLKAEVARLRAGLRDAALIIEKMANGASRKDVDLEFLRFLDLLVDQDGAK